MCILVFSYTFIAAMTVFCVFMAEYAWRRVNNRPFRKFVDEESENLPMDRHMKRLVFGICLSTLFVYIRYASGAAPIYCQDADRVSGPSTVSSSSPTVSRGRSRILRFFSVRDLTLGGVARG